MLGSRDKIYSDGANVLQKFAGDTYKCASKNGVDIRMFPSTAACGPKCDKVEKVFVSKIITVLIHN